MGDNMTERILTELAARASIAFCVLHTLVASGCRSDTAVPADTTLTGGATGGVALGGSGDTGAAPSARSGAAGAAGTSGAAGSSGASAPVICGAETCKASLFVGACCTKSNTCGLGTAQECLETNQQGTLDARCADQALIAFGSFAKGCCKANGNCGLMIERPSLGCVERTAIPSWASSGNKWTAATCADSDAGM